MAVELVRPEVSDAEILGKIVFQAFAELFARHGLECDFPSAAAAGEAMRMFIARRDIYGVAARVDGRLVGSNFIQCADAVGGVGPISVLPGIQAKGIGRKLMENVIEYARVYHGPQIRLLQDAINVVSLSLYTSLGFEVKEPVVMLTIPPALRPDPRVRLATQADIDACDALCREIYRVSRRNELAGLISHGAMHGLRVLVREEQGRISGYAIPGFFGHGVGRTNEDLFQILTTAMALYPAAGLPLVLRTTLCPSRNGDLYRRLLKAGGKAVRNLHLMAMGPYEEARGAWYPSIAY